MKAKARQFKFAAANGDPSGGLNVSETRSAFARWCERRGQNPREGDFKNSSRTWAEAQRAKEERP